MFKFILIVLLLGPESAVPVKLQPFESLADCDRSRIETVKLVPKRADINFVAVCVPVMNGTQVSA